MHCVNCENSIMNILKENPGVIKVSADHTTQKVQLYYDQDKTQPLKLKELIEKIGFPVTSTNE